MADFVLKQLTNLRQRINLAEPQVDYDCKINEQQNTTLDEHDGATVELAELHVDNSTQIEELQGAVTELADMIASTTTVTEEA